MKKNITVMLMIILLFSGCLAKMNTTENLVSYTSMDADTYIYSEKVMVEKYELYDTLSINVKSNGDDNWLALLQGYIKRFAYDDGILILEFYDKWFTFDVENYVAGKLIFNLKEYENESQIKEEYPDLDTLMWLTGNYKRTNEVIKSEGLSEDYKTTEIFEYDSKDIFDY